MYVSFIIYTSSNINYKKRISLIILVFSQCLKRTYPGFGTVTPLATGRRVNIKRTYPGFDTVTPLATGRRVKLKRTYAGFDTVTPLPNRSFVKINNFLKNSLTPKDTDAISNDIINNKLKFRSLNIATIFLSSITYSTQINFQLIRNLNSLLYNACIKYGFKFVDNGDVSKSDLCRGGIHLLGSVKAIIANNFINNINLFREY